MGALDFIEKELSTTDSEWIAQLYNSEYQGLIDYAKYIVFDKNFAEDSVQEVFAIAAEKISDLRSSEKPVGWLYRTLQNVVYNKNREIIKPNKIFERIMQFSQKSDIGVAESFESQLLFFESYKNLVKELDWILLQERYCDGYQYDDLAKRHNLSVSACKMRILRAKSVLRKEMEKNL